MCCGSTCPDLNTGIQYLSLSDIQYPALPNTWYRYLAFILAGEIRQNQHLVHFHL
jgi:hypothetical protein